MSDEFISMYTPDGERVKVRESNYKAALDKGLKIAALHEAEQDAAKSPVVSALEKVNEYTEPFTRGLANAASAGFVDEGAGAIAKLRGKGYEQGRQEYRVADDKAYKESPYIYGTGYGLGSVVSPAVKAGGVIAGGLQGLLSSLGGGTDEKQPDIVGKNADPAAYTENALTGAATGGILANVLPKLAQKATGKLRKSAAENAYSSTGAIKEDIKKLYGEATPESIGRTLLDQDLIPFLGAKGGDAIEENVGKGIQKTDKYQADVISKLGEKGPVVDNMAIINKILSEVDETGKIAGQDAYTNALKNKVEKYAEVVPKQKLTAQEALEQKQGYNSSAKFDKGNEIENANAEAARRMRSTINDELFNTTEKELGAEARQAYQANNKTAQQLYSADAAIANSKKRQLGNNVLGLGDVASLSAAIPAAMYFLSQGKLLEAAGAVAAPAAIKGARTFGNAATANTQDFLAKLGEGKVGKSAVNAIVNRVGPTAASDIINSLLNKKEENK